MLTQQRLGWHPSQPSFLADLDQGLYFEIWKSKSVAGLAD